MCWTTTATFATCLWHDLQPGDRVLVRPGEKVPIDGQVVKGASSLNEAMLTGESTPVDKREGDTVIGGSINGEGSLEVSRGKDGSRHLSGPGDRPRQAGTGEQVSQSEPGRSGGVRAHSGRSFRGCSDACRLADPGKELRVLSGTEHHRHGDHLPPRLGLAIPLVVAVSTSLAAKRGLLIRDRTAFERSRSVNAVVFDKTGTLTEGRFGVSQVWTFGDQGEDEVLALAASLESRSEHPIAQGIVRSAQERRLTLLSIDDFSSIPGKGVEATIEGRQLSVVSPGYLAEQRHRGPVHRQRRRAFHGGLSAGG